MLRVLLETMIDDADVYEVDLVYDLSFAMCGCIQLMLTN